MRPRCVATGSDGREVTPAGPCGGEEQETLVLTDHRTLDAPALDRVRAAALRLDERAYRFQPEIWSTTPPAAHGEV